MLALGLLLAGCGDAPDKTTKEADSDAYGNQIELADDYDPNGHFDWAYTAFASNWDPTKSVTGADINFYEPVYDRLLREDAEGKVGPMLAQEFTPSSDNKTLTLKLREGLKFSDGTPFNAEAVKFNLERAKALNMAIDREAISQGLYDGYCTPQIQPFQQTSPGYSEKIGDGLDIFPYDPEKAKKIMQDAGVTELNMATAAPNVTIYTKFAEVVQSQLKEIGINLEIHSLPPTPQVQEFAIDKTTETFTSVFTGINDPDAIWGRYLGAEGAVQPRCA